MEDSFRAKQTSLRIWSCLVLKGNYTCQTRLKRQLQPRSGEVKK